MTAPPSATGNPGRHTLDGTIRGFLAEALIFPTGLVTTAFLTRQFGLDGYGLFTLTATLVAWIEWSITAIFGRATFKCVSEATDWRPVGTTVLRLHLYVSVAVGALLAVLARPIANALAEPALATYLQLFAIDVPIFCAAHAHRNILIGTGGFRERAIISAGRWTFRLVLIVAFVMAGWSLHGAILGCIGASLLELALARYFIRPALFGHTDFPARKLWDYALPLFVMAMAMRLYDKMDLFLLKSLGGTTALAGVYGGAQNLAIVPGIFALSFTPLLLSTLTRLLRDGQEEHAKAMARDALRLVVLLLPFAGLTAGAADEIVRAVLGHAFADAAPLLALLIFGGLANTFTGVATAILIATNRPRWALYMTLPVVPLALAGHLVMIPRFGAVGAASVTTAVAFALALLALSTVYRLWRILPPLPSLLRSVAVSALAYALAVGWPVGSVWLLVKLPAITVVIVVAFFVLGEFSVRELTLARSLLPWNNRSSAS